MGSPSFVAGIFSPRYTPDASVSDRFSGRFWGHLPEKKDRMKIFNQRLPENPNLHRLPGTRPVEADHWLEIDDAFAGQMAYRDQLLVTKRADVFQCDPGADQAAAELLDRVVDHVLTQPGYERAGNFIRRPDDCEVELGSDHPLIVAARLVQEDLCILEKRGGQEHLLTGAVLCFPASWSLGEKFMHPMSRIHAPVTSYDTRIEKGVQRMFDVLRPGMVLCRGNLLAYRDADLHSPRTEGNRRNVPVYGAAEYLRAERQCLIRLAKSDAITFTIHSYVVPRTALQADQKELIDRLNL